MKMYEVSVNIFSDKEDELEIVKETLEFLNSLEGDRLLDYVYVWHNDSDVDYEKICKGEFE